MTAVADIELAASNKDDFRFPAAPADILLTEHAIERYRDRVRPGLDLDQARDELYTLMRSIGTFQDRKPDWSKCDLPVQVFMMLGPDVCLPIRSLKAVSCLTSGWVEPAERRQRKRARQQRRSPGKRSNGARRLPEGREANTARHGRDFLDLDWAA